MNTLTIDHNNGHKTTYKLIDSNKPMPIAYHLETNYKLVNTLERIRLNRQRVRIYLGDIKTGKCWNEEHCIFGYVGLSKGTKAYYPILVINENSSGGGSLLDHCIIKIKESKGDRVLYQAENFQQPVIEIKPVNLAPIELGVSHSPEYTYSLYIDGELYSNHTTLKQAERLKKKMS